MRRVASPKLNDTTCFMELLVLRIEQALRLLKMMAQKTRSVAEDSFQAHSKALDNVCADRHREHIADETELLNRTVMVRL
mmetsp:Transcript_2160/g.6437  ORF Transcript_2160/g.6437 Transcript_2160/m.6437 type:complete len:80 (-) Transcript_2160:413-652(-)